MSIDDHIKLELVELTNDMANDLQCYAADTEGNGPGLEHTNTLISRWDYLRNKINNQLAQHQGK